VGEGLPRELSPTEVEALWAAATDDGRLVLAGLLSGLKAEELAALSWEDVDLTRRTLTVRGGRSARILPLAGALGGVLDRRWRASGQYVETGLLPHAMSGPVLSDSPDALPLSVRDVEGLVACAAHDAGVDDAIEVTAAVLRHTYVAFLVRQGARLADIERVVGRLPPAAYTHYGRLSPPGAGISLDRIETAYLDVAGADEGTQA
jgi:integrase